MNIPGFRQVAHTGVIYVTERASAKGYQANDQSWSNLGQGSPEVGSISGAPSRLSEIKLADFKSHHYSPVAGDLSLRKKVAAFYNKNFRQNYQSQYTWRNVCITGGGRQALSRLIAGLDDINVGHFLPDYTAYDELLSTFKRFNPIPIPLEKEAHYRISVERLEKEITDHGLRTLLVSNPCNPTGQLIRGQVLADWVNLARESHCSIIMDEFYSHYIYPAANEKSSMMVSSAEYIRDVNKDPIVIVDGVTKNWRYPGWRIGWIVAPEPIIRMAGATGSYLDGGANHLFQYCTTKLLDVEQCEQELKAINKLFYKKRQYAVDRLRNMGIKVNVMPQGGFYLWVDLSGLPAPLNHSNIFFEEALTEKVITVPGFFFDVNPGGRRLKHQFFTDHCRISFGPSQEVLEQGLDGIEKVIAKYR